MAGCCFSVQALFLTCLFWGAWLGYITSANQGMTKANCQYMHTPYTFTFILVLLLGVIFHNLRCLPFEKKLKLNMGEDYTWLCAKQNERFRSHDFWLKLWIQYTTTYNVMRYPKSKNYKLEKKPKRARLRCNRNKILKTVLTALDKSFWNDFYVFI